MGTYNLASLLGIFVLLAFAWLFSPDKKNINWKAVLWGTALEIVFAFVIFIVPAGTKIFLFINDVVVKILDSATAGARFLFGRLALPPGATNEAGEPSLGFFLAFQGFPTIVFFSALISILYFFNIMPTIIRGFAWLFTRLMHISGAESLVAASNIFVGVESALTVKPCIAQMTRSELHTVLTAGMATVASNVLAVYVFMLKSTFPTIAGHLISASFLSAPAAIVMSKLILPEQETPRTLGQNIPPYYEKENNLLESIINGANTGVKFVVGISALLLAVLGLAALVDLGLAAVGKTINGLAGWQIDWSLKGLAGYLFYPFTFILGIPTQDADTVSRLIGERLIVTEVVAYQDLATALADNLISARSAVITSYALCGFAHIASLAIFVGGTAALAPGKTRVLSQVALRALLAATLACFMTACIAGTFASNGSILTSP